MGVNVPTQSLRPSHVGGRARAVSVSGNPLTTPRANRFNAVDEGRQVLATCAGSGY